jgi:hypothetical protein
MEEKDVNAFHQGNFKTPSLRISTPHKKKGWGDREMRRRGDRKMRG